MYVLKVIKDKPVSICIQVKITFVLLLINSSLGHVSCWPLLAGYALLSRISLCRNYGEFWVPILGVQGRYWVPIPWKIGSLFGSCFNDRRSLNELGIVQFPWSSSPPDPKLTGRWFPTCRERQRRRRRGRTSPCISWGKRGRQTERRKFRLNILSYSKETFLWIFIMPTPIIAHKETNFPIKVLKKRHYALMRLKMAPKPLSGGERMLTQEKKIHIFWKYISGLQEIHLVCWPTIQKSTITLSNEFISQNFLS